MPEEKAPKAPKTEKPAEKAPVEAEAKAETKAEQKPAGKKVNKKVIIGAAAAVVAVGGGVAVAYAVNNTPENVAVSAITNFINSDALSVTGTINIDASKSGIKELKIELKAKSDKEKQAETTASLKADLGFFKIDVSLGSVLVKDHTIYLKLDGLKDSINKALFMMPSAITSDRQTGAIITLVKSVAEKVDGEWWKIDVPEIIDSIDTMASSEKAEAKSTYACVMDSFDKLKEKNGEVADLYKKNPFVKIEKYSGDKTFSTKGVAYTVSFDNDKAKAFYNDSKDIAKEVGFDKCVKNTEDITVKEGEASTTIEKMPEIIMTIDGFFSHELTGVYMDVEDESFDGKIELKFEKPEGEIKAPEGAKSVKTLVDDLSPMLGL